MSDETKQEKPKRKRSSKRTSRRSSRRSSRRRSAKGGLNFVRSPLAMAIADAYIEGMRVAVNGPIPSLAEVGKYALAKAAVIAGVA